MPKQNSTISPSIREIRAIGDDGEGIIEGYAAVWGVVDGYNSRFQRGAFKKTLENRMDKIRVLWNHNSEQPVGKLLDIKEDDHGLFVRAKLILTVNKAKETFDLIRGGAVDSLSFGFRTIKDKYENGVQVITEVRLAEISPVVFEASASSVITEARAENFDATAYQNEIAGRGYKLCQALDQTFEEIWWFKSSDKISLLQAAIDDFNNAYMQWAQELLDFQSTDSRSLPMLTNNALTAAFRAYCDKENITLEQLSQQTTFTLDELRALRSGKNITDFIRLKDLDQDIYDAHNNIRNKAVETLCTELRAGLNPAEAIRIEALLHSSLHNEADVSSIVSYMSNFRNKLNQR
jgi:HK97 family phage prohead protease